VWKSLYDRGFDSGKSFQDDNERIFWAIKANKVPIVAYLLKKNPTLLEVTMEIYVKDSYQSGRRSRGEVYTVV
jgi:hypothetical protein